MALWYGFANPTNIDMRLSAARSEGIRPANIISRADFGRGLVTIDVSQHRTTELVRTAVLPPDLTLAWNRYSAQALEGWPMSKHSMRLNVEGQS